jgi:hypothetical protein
MKSPVRGGKYHVVGVCALIMLTLSASISAAGQRTAPASIVGSAWKGDNTPFAHAKLRLRSVVSGKIQATKLADETGRFAFDNLGAGSYFIELISDNGTVLAFGHTLTLAPGDIVATLIRMGTKVPWFTGFFTSAAAAITSAAASTGVTAILPDVMRCASPPCSVE